MRQHFQYLPKSFSAFSIIVSFVLLALMGLALIPKLSYRLNPSGNGSMLYISFAFPGASPESVEQQVTSILEGAISSLSCVKQIDSQSGEGWGELSLELVKDADRESSRAQVLNAIRQLKGRLPERVGGIQLMGSQADEERQVQVLSYTFNGTVPSSKLKKLAEDRIVEPLSLVEGVGKVIVYGAEPEEIAIQAKAPILNRYGLTLSDIENAIREYLTREAVGISTEPDGTILLVTTGAKLSFEELNSLPITSINGRLVLLGQVAEVVRKDREPEILYRINGKTSITMTVMADSYANQLAVANAVYAVVAKVEKKLPPGVFIVKAYDNTNYLRKELSRSAVRTIFSVIVLLLFVLLVNRSFRQLLLVAIGLVVNICVAVFFYYILRIEINLYSLSGVTLSLGLIIDNTLVMVDHLMHRRSFSVFLAILAATLTTVGALVSIFFLEEASRVVLTDFAWVVTINLLVSLAVAALLVPALAQNISLVETRRKRYTRILRLQVYLSRGYRWVVTLFVNHRKVVLVSGLLIIGTPIFLLPNKVEEGSWYAAAYNKTLGSEFYLYRIKPTADKMLGGSIRLFYKNIWEKEYSFSGERTSLVVSLYLPDGATLNQTDDLARLVEGLVLKYKEVEQVQTTCEKAEARVRIYFHPSYEFGDFPYILKSKLERMALTQAGADFSVYGVGQGFSNSSPVGFANSVVLMYGYSNTMLIRYAQEFADSLQKKYNRIEKTYIRGGQQWMFRDNNRMVMHLSDGYMAAARLTPVGVADFLTVQSPSNDILLRANVGSSSELVRIKMDMDGIPEWYSLGKEVVGSVSSNLRVSSIATVNKEERGDLIYKENQQYVVTLAWSFVGPSELADIVLKEEAKIMNSKLPLGFTAKTRTFSGWDKHEKSQYFIIILMVAVIFFICAILFESLLKPLAVIAMVPLSFVGVFITFFLFDLNFDQGTYASFILLGGIVVNSSIFVINEMNGLRKIHPNASMVLIYSKSIDAKIIPIVLTVVSTVLGLAPFILFSEKESFWYSLAMGTSGGLLFSVVALLVWLPVLLPTGWNRGSINHKKES